MDSKLRYLLFLHHLYLDSPRKAIEYFKQYETFDSFEHAVLSGSIVFPKRFSQEGLKLFESFSPEKYYEDAERHDAVCITLLDACYPDQLKEIYDPPLVLFAKGNLAILKAPQIAIVGTRKVTDYGKKVTSWVTKGLSSYFVITSGLAIGVDSVSHQSALDSGGQTVAVIATGLDTVYPARNTLLFRSILEKNGVIISEYPFESKAFKHRFPKRNRIISGLSKGVVVSEAGLGSGALITAREALDQNRDVFAIPASIFSESSEGVHSLIQEGAKLVHSIGDILEEYHVKLMCTSKEREKVLKRSILEKKDTFDKVLPIEKYSSKKVINLSDKEQKIINNLNEQSLTIEALSIRSGLPVHELVQFMTLLEMKGMIKKQGSIVIRL